MRGKVGDLFLPRESSPRWGESGPGDNGLCQLTALEPGTTGNCTAEGATGGWKTSRGPAFRSWRGGEIGSTREGGERWRD